MNFSPKTSARPWAAFSSLLILMAFLCCGQAKERSDKKIRIAVSIFPIADIADRIGGERCESFYAVPRGANPHTFEPLPSIVRQLQASTIFIGVHPEFDGWIEKFIGEGTKVSYLLGQNDQDNPHIWLSLKGGDKIARHIQERLSEIDKDGEAYYAGRISLFQKQLTELDGQITGMFRDLPDKSFMQWHPSWDYFAAEYGLDIVGTIEKGHGREPSVGEFNRLVQTARAGNIRVIVIDLRVQSGAAKALARETGATLLRLDAIGDPNDPTVNGYLSILKHNAALLSQALLKSGRG